MFNTTVSVNVVCRKDKKNQQNEVPLYVRLAYNNQRKLVAPKERINIEYWNFETNEIKPNYPNKAYLEIIIKEKTQEIDKKILALNLANKPFTLDDIIESEERKKRATMTVKKLFESYIKELFSQDRIKNAKYYRCCLNCLLDFTNGKDPQFIQIDASFLSDFSNWMQKKKLHKNTIGNRLRGSKAIYNQVVLQK